MRKHIKNKLFIYTFSISLVLLSATGCGDFLDINTDPNNPLTSRLNQILPSVEAIIVESFGHGSGGLSDFTSQFVHHTVQRGQSNFYFVAGNEFAIASAWPNLYSGALRDIEDMIKIAEENDSYHYLGIAQTLKAYSFSLLVDIWGKAVFTQFGQGTTNPFPTYDDGADIYPQLLTLLDAGFENLKKTPVQRPSIDDLIYAGDIGKWLRFNNSLKLKLYNQVRLTNLYDATKVNQIIASDTMLADVGDGFKLLYNDSNNPENRHPLYKKDYVDNNANYIDPYFFLVMNGSSAFNPLLAGVIDPRIPYYFYNQLATGEDPQNPATTAKFGNFLSIWFASFNIDPNEGFDQAQSQTLVGLYPAGGAFDDGLGLVGGVAEGQNPGLGGASYQRLYTYFSHLFTRAELALTEGAEGDDAILFEQGIRAAFDEVNELADSNPIPSEQIDNYVTDIMTRYYAATPEGRLEHILTQKWIASFGFSIDAYTDYRRTGYPVLFDPATDNNPFTILNRSYPVSFPYFIDDLQINPNSPAQRNPGTDKIFWDLD